MADVASLRVRRFETSKRFNFESFNVSEIESLKGVKVREFESSKDRKFAKFEGVKHVEMESSKVRRVSSSKVGEFESLKVETQKFQSLKGSTWRSRVLMLFAGSILGLKHVVSCGDSGSPCILSIHRHLAIPVIIPRPQSQPQPQREPQ